MFIWCYKERSLINQSIAQTAQSLFGSRTEQMLYVGGFFFPNHDLTIQNCLWNKNVFKYFMYHYYNLFEKLEFILLTFEFEPFVEFTIILLLFNNIIGIP